MNTEISVLVRIREARQGQRGRAGAGVVPSAALCAYLVPGSLNSLELTYLGACP